MTSSIKYKEVLFSDHYEKLKPVFEEHFKEVGHAGGPDRVDIDACYYLQHEQLGALKCFAALDGDEVVGYISATMYSHPHYRGTRFAATDALYVSPEHRKSRVGLKLIQFTEHTLSIKYGVKYLQIVSNSNLDLSKYLERQGYSKSDITFCKRI